MAAKDRKIAALKVAIPKAAATLYPLELFSSSLPILDTLFRKKRERLEEVERAR